MRRTTVELYGFATYSAFMCLTQLVTCEVCASLALSLSLCHVTDRIKLLMVWDIPQICLYEQVPARAESTQSKAERNECDLGISHF